ncbi:MAG TPA: RNA polymerase-binding protein DksA [Telluria sp.]|nr:RNA polymerase-binding protein DksA [Telluria sp.]
MKETVTKSSKKIGGAAAGKTSASALVKKTKPKAQAAPVSKPAARPAAKGGAKSAPASKAKPAVKAAPKKAVPKAAPKPAAKAVKAAAKPAVKAVKAAAPAKKAAPTKPAASKAAPVKKAAKPAAQAAGGKHSAAAAKASPKAAEAGSKKTARQQAVMAADTSVRTTAVTGAAAGLADKMKTSVVSKVSEVMTKTTKSTPAVNTEGRLLTEDEIRSMNEKDYMNPAQLAFFKARLQQLEKDLLKNAGETTEHLRETVLVPDPADRATIEEEHALELRTRDRERKLLKKVQQSIAAIDGGDYGWCEETGEPIGIPRLIARPTATLSLEAQQRRELKQKLYGD